MVRRLKRFNKARHDVDALVAAVTPLLEMFATMDAVFTEDDALTTHARTSLGRLYEQWKTTRAALDPEFDPTSGARRRPMARRFGKRADSPGSPAVSAGAIVPDPADQRRRRTARKRPSEGSDRRA